MTLGNDSHYQLVTGESIEGVSMGAHVDFLRVATQPQSLRQLTLDLYRDEPVPRWDIRPSTNGVMALKGSCSRLCGRQSPQDVISLTARTFPDMTNTQNS